MKENRVQRLVLKLGLYIKEVVWFNWTRIHPGTVCTYSFILKYALKFICVMCYEIVKDYLRAEKNSQKKQGDICIFIFKQKHYSLS